MQRFSSAEGMNILENDTSYARIERTQWILGCCQERSWNSDEVHFYFDLIKRKDASRECPNPNNVCGNCNSRNSHKSSLNARLMVKSPSKKYVTNLAMMTKEWERGALFSKNFFKKRHSCYLSIMTCSLNNNKTADIELPVVIG